MKRELLCLVLFVVGGCSQAVSGQDAAVPPLDAATLADGGVPNGAGADASFSGCCIQYPSRADGGYLWPPIYNFCLDQTANPGAGTRDAGAPCARDTDCVGSWFATDAGPPGFYLTACEAGRCITPTVACQLGRCSRPPSDCTPITP